LYAFSEREKKKEEPRKPELSRIKREDLYIRHHLILNRAKGGKEGELSSKEEDALSLPMRGLGKKKGAERGGRREERGKRGWSPL